jgi:hypothetical protein
VGSVGGEEESVCIPELVDIYKLVRKSVLYTVLWNYFHCSIWCAVSACIELGPSEGRVSSTPTVGLVDALCFVRWYCGSEMSRESQRERV